MRFRPLSRRVRFAFAPILLLLGCLLGLLFTGDGAAAAERHVALQLFSASSFPKLDQMPSELRKVFLALNVSAAAPRPAADIVIVDWMDIDPLSEENSWVSRENLVKLEEAIMARLGSTISAGKR